MSSPWYEQPPPGSVTGPPLWLPFDYQSVALYTPKATGVAGETLTATLGPVPAGELWAVNRSTISVAYTTAENLNQAGPVVRHYLDAASPQNLLSGSNSGDYDEADYPGVGMLVPEGRTLLAVWGAGPGATIGVQNTGIGCWRVQFTRLKRGGS